MISTRSPIESVWPNAIELEPVDADVNAIAVVPPGNVEVLATRRPRADEDGVVVLGEQVAEAVHRGVQAKVDTHVDDRRDLLVEDLRRQPEGRNVRAHEATGHVVLLEDRHVVAKRQEVVGDRQ